MDIFRKLPILVSRLGWPVLASWINENTPCSNRLVLHSLRSVGLAAAAQYPFSLLCLAQSRSVSPNIKSNRLQAAHRPLSLAHSSACGTFPKYELPCPAWNCSLAGYCQVCTNNLKHFRHHPNSDSLKNSCMVLDSTEIQFLLKKFYNRRFAHLFLWLGVLLIGANPNSSTYQHHHYKQ